MAIGNRLDRQRRRIQHERLPIPSYQVPVIDRTFNLYAYRFVLNHSKAVQSFALSNNRDVIVLAATLTEDLGRR